jgi:hypothetical protein
MQLEEIQNIIANEKADAWIMVDYENRNPTLVRLLGDKMLTRKIFMVIPKTGKPYLICHIIDTVYLNDPQTKAHFDLKVYKTWREMLELEKKAFASYHVVLMDISEIGLLPRVSLADWGSVDFVKSLGLEVRSSADVPPRAHRGLFAASLSTAIKSGPVNPDDQR